MQIRLDDPRFIPESLNQALKKEWSALQSAEYMETLTERDPFRNIAIRLETFIRENHIVGYHCTKEPSRGYFLENGLRILDREAHQREFLATHGNLFSEMELEAIQSAWASYFPGMQDSARNGILWFCLSPYLVVNDGTAYFFEYYGGEAVHMPLDNMPEIMNKLRTLGLAVVVEVRIDPNELHALGDFPLALNALSHYHRLANPLAYIHSREGYLNRDVRPDEIVRVVLKNDFFSQYSTD